MLIAMAQDVPKVPAADEGRWRIVRRSKKKTKAHLGESILSQ